ncbi:MAG: NADH:flavin oxidoreductase [Candidatus Aminicenantes bacterium]|nr:MAG: NADH:flavin oxidoreductase [Candidatus Aminicenantes bacterium]
MSVLFEPIRLANLQIKNRFVCSATYEGLARETGMVTEKIVKRYHQLAKGDVGLIVTGHMYVHPHGQAFKHQTGIHNDDMIPGLSGLAQAVHQEGGKIVFQLAHAGRQTTKAVIGQVPIGPSGKGRDPVYFVKPKRMEEEQIQEVIRSFAAAARRAVKAGADGIQLHAAHGYLINQFLSPFFNTRNDAWGGSEENRFRFLKEIIVETKKELTEKMLLLVKLNTHDYTPRQGITPLLAKQYAQKLSGLGIDGLEISCGTPIYSFMNMCRGHVPVKELLEGLPWWKKPVGKRILTAMAGKYDLQEGYNLEAAKMIKPVIGKVRLFLVGGLRRVSYMEDILEKGYADFISMSRPFIRDPFLVRKFKEGESEVVSCVSCNQCLAAVANNMPVRCYKLVSG